MKWQPQPEREASSSDTQSLFILADATPRFGAGHVMRCAALAEAWQKREVGRAFIIGEVSIPFAMQRLEDAGVEILAHPFFVSDHDVVLVDSYESSVRLRGAAMAAAGLRVFTSDVAEQVPPGFDAVWNPNAYGSAELYSEFEGPVIAGQGTVPLRGDLRVWRRPGNGAFGAALGGGDPPQVMTSALIKLRASMPEVRFSATGNPPPVGWDPVCADRPWEYLAACQAVITAASVTLWEASAVGVPVVVVQAHENQRLVFDYAIRHGVPYVNCVEFTDSETLCDVIRAALDRARPAPRLENGAPRVVDALLQLVRSS